jgi:TolB-like protein
MDRQRWSQICAEFDELVGLDTSQRANHLEAIGATDPELRHSVEALLLADAQADARLCSIELTFLSPERNAPSSAPPEQAPDPLALVGRITSHFRVLEVLESGGMGMVFRAEDIRLGRTVALKFLLPQHQLNAPTKARFLEEARVIAALDHPNLCAIHEVGVSEQGQHFLAMPLYQGETLKARLARSGPLAPEEALEIVAQVAQGLSCAHAAGVVHRDLKPGNLLLTASGGVKILDFGLASVMDRSVTAPSPIIGTVAYMAPEQLRNEVIDPRTDLWALGVVLYEMLTGQRPFEGANTVEVARAILHEQPARPATLRSDLSTGIESLVTGLLQKDPALRFSSTEAWLAELAAARSAEGRLPSRDGSIDAAVSEARGRGRWARITAVSLVLVALCTVAAVGVAIRDRRIEPAVDISAERSVAVLPFANLSTGQDSEYFADGITEEILTTLASIADLRVISRTSVMRYKGTLEPIREIAGELGVAHVLQGSVRRDGDRVRITAQLIDARTDEHLWAERFDGPLEDIFAVQTAIAQQIAYALRSDLSSSEQTRLERRPTANLTAHDYVLRAGEYLRAGNPRDTEVALPLLRRARELDPEYPDAFAALAAAFRDQTRSDPDNARMWLDSAAVAARRAIALDPDFAPGHAELGWALDHLGDRDAALQAHQRAVRLNSTLSAGLANVYHYGFGRLDEAARWWRPALEADPTNFIVNWLAGRTFLQLGMPARARPLLENAIALQPGFWWPYYHLSIAFLMEGRAEEARAQIAYMLLATNEDPYVLLFAGEAMVAMGDLVEARRYAERGLARLPAGFNLDQHTLGIVWIFHEFGETERAQVLLQGAAQQLEARWVGGPRRPEDFMDLANVRFLQGDREGALQLFEQAVGLGWRFHNENPNDPISNSMRADPRFDRLLTEVQADVARQRARAFALFR